MKSFTFRFDIDTPRCLGQGVPRLIDLAEKLGVRFTFFLNVGRSVSVSNFILNKIRSVNSQPAVAAAAALSARRKLGNFGYLYTALVNPRIGDRYPEIVKRLAKSQELGLHGGKNHELWHNHIREWSVEKTKCEIRWALDWLQRHNLNVEGFSSPGWSDRPDLPELLDAFGFSYRADRHGPSETWDRREGKLINLGTNITGEPGGVAYLEHQRAMQRNDQQILKDLEDRLEASPDYAVVYDHPYYAGINEISMIEQIVRLVEKKGYQVQTLGEVARYCNSRVAAGNVQ